MRKILITSIHGLKQAEDKQAFADELYDFLTRVAEEKKGRLGKKYELVSDDCMRISIAKDDLLPVVRDAVQRIGMKVDARTAVDALVDRYSKRTSE